MRTRLFHYFLFFIFFICLGNSSKLWAQAVPGSPITLQNAPQRDTNNKTNTKNWVDENANIYYQKINSQIKYYPDTLLKYLHRRSFSQPWMTNTGNFGSPETNQFFTPDNCNGPSLGYHAFDPYRFNPDSLNFYNTTRPYTQFVYQLGSKLEQQASILHTQNIKPNWNFAFQYRKITSPGYYKIQPTNNDNGAITSNYTSPNEHYILKAAIVYNKEQNDENGGIEADSFLTLSDYSNRQVIPVNFQDDSYNTVRSSVTNKLRDFGVLLQHSYTIGKADTTYSEDSTQFFYHLIPKFRITHRLQVSSEKYQYKDLAPDSLRYTPIFTQGFSSEDSVVMIQKWLYADNSLLLNGFIGKENKQLEVNAGIGIRADKFTTDYVTDKTDISYISNYLIADLKKEALQEKQWNYQAYAKLFFTGQTAGNFMLHAAVGKDISMKLGTLQAGFHQELNNAPYNYTTYQNQYYSIRKDYDKESITQIFASWNNQHWQLNAGIKNYLIANYFYLNQNQEFSQQASAFNITQVWLNKTFHFGSFMLDNELAYQQKTAGAPVNIPAFMGRHRLAIETRAFKKALGISSGIDIRYHTSYKSAGYSPFFNRFYYQDSYTVSNFPQVALFFNFKVKNFRAYVMADQVQHLLGKNYISLPGYPLQNTMFRLGFNWVMVN